MHLFVKIYRMTFLIVLYRLRLYDYVCLCSRLQEEITTASIQLPIHASSFFTHIQDHVFAIQQHNMSRACDDDGVNTITLVNSKED